MDHLEQEFLVLAVAKRFGYAELVLPVGTRPELIRPGADIDPILGPQSERLLAALIGGYQRTSVFLPLLQKLGLDRRRFCDDDLYQGLSPVGNPDGLGNG